MITKLTGVVWKILPARFRSKIVRLTQPKFTFSAAAVITNEHNKVLLLNHVLRPQSGWGLPGGFLNHGEQPESGIKREIMEETGIELDGLRMFRIRTINTHVEVLFAATSKGTAEVKSREIKELGWFALEAMPEKLNPGQRKIIEEVLRGDV